MALEPVQSAEVFFGEGCKTAGFDMTCSTYYVLIEDPLSDDIETGFGSIHVPDTTVRDCVVVLLERVANLASTEQSTLFACERSRHFLATKHKTKRAVEMEPNGLASRRSLRQTLRSSRTSITLAIIGFRLVGSLPTASRMAK